MKAVLWLAAVVLLLVTVATAEEGVSPQDLGVLDPVQVEERVVVPKTGLWRAPQGDFVCADSVSVSPESGRALLRRAREPRLGQFSYQLEGAIVFPNAEVGRQFTARYQFRPRRVALLAAATPTGHQSAPSGLEQALTEELGKRGFVVVPAQEVREAAARLALGAITPRALPPPEKLAALARGTNTAYVLVPGVAVRQHSRPGEFDTGIPIPSQYKPGRLPDPFFDVPRERRTRPWTPVLEEEPTLVLPTTHYRLYGGVRLVVVAGATGAVLHDETGSGSQRVRWRRFSSARRSLVQSLAAQAVVRWRGPVR